MTKLHNMDDQLVLGGSMAARIPVDVPEQVSELIRRAAEPVPIAALLPADSPRLEGEDPAHIRALTDLDDRLPPIVVHRNTMRVVDGMHRLRAAMLRGEQCVEVLYFDGSDDDAFVLSVKLNAVHGLPLSRADRAAAAARIIRSHPLWSDRLIASATGLSDKTVAALRWRSTSESPQSDSRIGRDGRLRPVNSADGRIRASEVIARNPDASLREIARVAGISVGTARDVRERMRLRQDPLLPRQRQARVGQPEDGQDTEPFAVAGRMVAIDHLKRDPSLRHNEIGRVMLRLLDAHSIGTDNWTRLIDNVPPYCREAVADAARGCAELWLGVARQLEQRRATD